MRRHAVLLYPDQGAEGKHGTSTYTIQSSKQDTVSATHYCQGFFLNCDNWPIVFHYWPMCAYSFVLMVLNGGSI
jgi:hypothetical protein